MTGKKAARPGEGRGGEGRKWAGNSAARGAAMEGGRREACGRDVGGVGLSIIQELAWGLWGAAQQKAEGVASRTHVRWPQIGPGCLEQLLAAARCGGDVGALLISISS